MDKTTNGLVHHKIDTSRYNHLPVRMFVSKSFDNFLNYSKSRTDGDNTDRRFNFLTPYVFFKNFQLISLRGHFKSSVDLSYFDSKFSLSFNTYFNLRLA